jgi:hypothetical protein
VRANDQGANAQHPTVASSAGAYGITAPALGEHVTAFTGRAVYMKDIRHPLMSYVEAEDRASDTVLNSVTVGRTRPCLMLYPVDNLQHSWKLYTLDTEQVIKRNALFPKPMAHAIINLMNECTRMSKGVSRNPSMFCNTREFLGDIENAEPDSGGHLDPGHIAGLADPAANLDYVASHLAEEEASPL